MAFSNTDSSFFTGMQSERILPSSITTADGLPRLAGYPFWCVGQAVLRKKIAGGRGTAIDSSHADDSPCKFSLIVDHLLFYGVGYLTPLVLLIA